MRRHVLRIALVGLVGLAGLVTAACAPAPTSTPPPSAPTTGTAAPTTGTGATQPPPPASEPADPPGVEYRVSYNWAVPGTEASITHPLTAPLPGPIGLPYLVGVYVGDHPEASPKYQRISFYYRLAFPSYRFQYVPQVVSDGSGEPVPLPGNAFLNIVFVDAQAHDDNGASTIAAKPPATIGFQNLRGYALAGDFEGYVTFGLGIQVAPGSDQALPIRAGELKKPDGSGGFFYVVHFDVQTG
jgi:hypothetical protein